MTQADCPTCLDPHEISSHPPSAAAPCVAGRPPTLVPGQSSGKGGDGKARRMERRLATNAALAEAADRAGKHDVAKALADCGHTQALWVCGACGKTTWVDYYCHHRLCAICGSMRQDERAARITEMAQGRSVRWLTLTQPRCKDVAVGVSNIRAAFGRWRRMKVIKNAILGGVYQIECLPKPDGWHVHLHALIEGGYLPKPIAWKTWAAALKIESASVNIQGAMGVTKIARYLAKYTCKPSDVAGNEARYIAMQADLTHSRLWGTFGTWHNALPKAKKPTPRACPHCGDTTAYVPVARGYCYFGRDWGTVYDQLIGNSPTTRPRPPPQGEAAA